MNKRATLLMPTVTNFAQCMQYMILLRFVCIEILAITMKKIMFTLYIIKRQKCAKFCSIELHRVSSCTQQWKGRYLCRQHHSVDVRFQPGPSCCCWQQLRQPVDLDLAKWPWTRRRRLAVNRSGAGGPSRFRCAAQWRTAHRTTCTPLCDEMCFQTDTFGPPM